LPVAAETRYAGHTVCLLAGLDGSRASLPNLLDRFLGRIAELNQKTGADGSCASEPAQAVNDDLLPARQKRSQPEIGVRPKVLEAAVRRPDIPDRQVVPFEAQSCGHGTEPGGEHFDLYSTVQDMYKWDRALTASKVLSKASMDKMYTPVLDKYGYGWSIDKQYGRLRYNHGGGINGFSTYSARFPEQNAVVVVFSNMDFGNTGEVAATVTRLCY
jgi:CubicO group peptidase (beta-lactamase class C family)